MGLARRIVLVLVAKKDYSCLVGYSNSWLILFYIANILLD